jgi:hypothetical protein
MSTRSVIAVARGDSWEGVYVHMDGYPTSMGPALWTTWRYRHNQDLPAFTAQEITAHRYGYSSYPDDPYAAEDEEQIFTAEDADEDALFIEWVYVFSRQTLTVFKSVPTARQQRRENAAGHWWIEPVYRWAPVAQVDLQGLEPDWDAIEQQGSAHSARAEQGAQHDVSTDHV